MRTKLLLLSVGVSAASALAHPIDFDQIKNWTGSGPNKAALVVQYNGDAYGADAYVWGYRWNDGESPTGETMMKAICANSSRLSMLTQFTGSMGSTLCGVGYGLNQEVLKQVSFNFEKAKEFEFINFDYYSVNTMMGQTSAPGDDSPALAKAAIDSAIAGNNCIQHPFDYGKYGYPAYDYDCWEISDSLASLGGASVFEPKWRSAWYEGYWSYWCANNASQDWMYSGSGFSGRTLSNGSVDGWSFTQFESAQVGGVGEGVAPCEDGQIVYMPSRLLSEKVDIDKCVRTVGEGSRRIPLLVRLAADSKINNVVLGLHFNSELPTAQEVMALLDADPAFKVAGNQLSIDADGDGLFNTSGYDSSCEGEWSLTEYEDCVVMACDQSAKPEYIIYLPAIGEAAAAIPERMTIALSDESSYIPVFAQRAAQYDAINYLWYRRADDQSVHSNTSSDIVTTISTSSTTLGKFTFAGTKAGDVYLHVRVRTGKGASYSYSNVCHFTLLPPAVPIETLSFKTDTVDSPLNRTIENEIIIKPSNATYTALTYSSSNTKVVTASATAIKTTTTAGTATVTVASKWDSSVKATFDVVSSLKNPVTDFTIKGVVGDSIVLNPKQMIGVIANPTPADADISDFDVSLTDNGDDRTNYIATIYQVNYWDENNTRTRFYELSGHRNGTCKLTLTSKDGSNVKKVYTVVVEAPDRTPLENGYEDGTLVINEEWFGHTNGGMNYITPEGEMMYQVYERENPGMSFGCTSQYAIIWGGKLIAISKQAADGGDPLPGGGRVVVADAKTLKRQGSIDNLMFDEETSSADGRAVAGATPEKVYVGTSNGIYIVDIDEVKVIGKIKAFDESGSTASDLYSGQVGDMINAGRYVFGIKQNTGAFAVDTETDEVVKEYALTTIQGVTQTADGNVWLATVVDNCARFICVNPLTLEEDEEKSVTFPSTVPAPKCSWGAWRNTAFVGSHTTNKIWFTGSTGITGGSATDKYYGWEVGSDPAALLPVFDMGAANLQGSNPRVNQKTYGTLRYDERSGELIVMTTENSASGHYRYNWTHFVDPQTGEIVRTIALRPYYWFQAFAIFPDKYAAEINLNDINIDVADGVTIIDLTGRVTDADNIDGSIKLSLYDSTESMTEAEAAEAHASVALDGNTLTVTPKSVGRHTFTLVAESNGRVTSKNLTVNVADVASGVADVSGDSRRVVCDGQRLMVSGFNGHEFAVYNAVGQQVASFGVDNDEYVFDFGSHSGVYVVSSNDNYNVKVIIKK